MDIGNIGLLFTFFLVCATGGVIFGRFRLRLDSSWPLLFYLALVAYSNKFDRVMNPYVLYVAVVCALLLRFEFMNDRIVFFIKVIEVVALAVIGFNLVTVLVKAF